MQDKKREQARILGGERRKASKLKTQANRQYGRNRREAVADDDSILDSYEESDSFQFPSLILPPHSAPSPRLYPPYSFSFSTWYTYAIACI